MYRCFRFIDFGLISPPEIHHPAVVVTPPPTPMTNPPNLCWMCWDAAANKPDAQLRVSSPNWGPTIDSITTWMLESPSNRVDVQALGGGTLYSNTWKSSISIYGGETYKQHAIRSFASFRAAVINRSGGRININRFRLSFGNVNSTQSPKTLLKISAW